MEGRIKVMGRGRCKQLLDYFKETMGYCKLKEEVTDHTLQKTALKRLWTCCKTKQQSDDDDVYKIKLFLFIIFYIVLQ
jgi:hypothetical protein